MTAAIAAAHRSAPVLPSLPAHSGLPGAARRAAYTALSGRD